MLFEFSGKVKIGQSRGKRLGFPTANINIEIHVPEGIYISYTKVSDTWYASVTFVGQAKTFHEETYQAESYILDFDRDIHNETITIQLVEKIRENQFFASVDELVEQMKKDIVTAREYFKTHMYV